MGIQNGLWQEFRHMEPKWWCWRPLPRPGDVSDGNKGFDGNTGQTQKLHLCARPEFTCLARVLHLMAHFMPSPEGSCTVWPTRCSQIQPNEHQPGGFPTKSSRCYFFLKCHMNTSHSQPGSSTAHPRSQIPWSCSFLSLGPSKVF